MLIYNFFNDINPKKEFISTIFPNPSFKKTFHKKIRKREHSSWLLKNGISVLKIIKFVMKMQLSHKMEGLD